MGKKPNFQDNRYSDESARMARDVMRRMLESPPKPRNLVASKRAKKKSTKK
jgi:hypothetical protein